jgi:hypothetical protein
MEEVKKQGMESLFVPYEIALALKELGFDEPCFGYYEPNGELDYIENHILKDFPYLAKNSEWQDLVAAPLYQQAFRWFREKYNLDHEINKHKNFESFMCRYGQNGLYEIIEEGIETYEEAELECLKKLIEIVKQK